jgi:hypothetical protein
MKDSIDACVQRSVESGRAAVVFIGSTAKRDCPPFIIGPMRESDRFVGCSFIIKDKSFVKQICDYADGRIDYVLVDVEDKTEKAVGILNEVISSVKKSKIKTYKGNDITVLACDLLINELKGDLKGKKVSIIGAGNLGLKVAITLAERGANVYISRRDAKTDSLATALNIIKNRYASGMIFSENNLALSARNADVLIGFTQEYPVINGDIIASLKKDALILDGGIGTVTEDAVSAASQAGLFIIRLDVRLVLPYIIDSILLTESFLRHTTGRYSENGKTFVAGGIIGCEGDIVLDRIERPNTIIGIADGKGGIRSYFQDLPNQKNETD